MAVWSQSGSGVQLAGFWRTPPNGYRIPIKDGAQKLCACVSCVRPRWHWRQAARGAVDSGVALCEGGRGFGFPVLRYFCISTDWGVLTSSPFWGVSALSSAVCAPAVLRAPPEWRKSFHTSSLDACRRAHLRSGPRPPWPLLIGIEPPNIYLLIYNCRKVRTLNKSLENKSNTYNEFT